MGFRESGETAKIELTYSITERHQQSGPALETLIVCIIQVLNHVFNALHPAGRLVIIDRGPLSGEEGSREFEAQHHERAPSGVETEIRETGFKLISRCDHFIDRPAVKRPGDRPDNRPWWLIVARKP